MFLATLGSTKPELTTGNISELFLLSKEFGFAVLLSEVSISGHSTELSMPKPVSAFAALQSKTYNKIEHLVYCRKRSLICGKGICRRLPH
jgi:hypothetical protein